MPNVQAPVESSPWGASGLVPAQEYAALKSERDALQRQLNALIARAGTGAHDAAGHPDQMLREAEEAAVRREGAAYEAGFQAGVEAGKLQVCLFSASWTHPCDAALSSALHPKIKFLSLNSAGGIAGARGCSGSGVCCRTKGKGGTF
jgi:hypothetical protein